MMNDKKKREKKQILRRKIVCLLLVIVSAIVGYVREPATHGPLIVIAAIVMIAAICIVYNIWRHHREE